MINPWPVVRADLRTLGWIAWVVPLVIALSVAVGIAISAQERALRTASARAADDFDLIVGAPGSQTQLVLSGVYLDREALPLMDGAVMRTLQGDPRAAGVAPVALGDVAHGYPIVGTTAAFATRWGRIAPSEGRLFAAEGEAVAGADVPLALGATITPSHGGHGGRAGEESPEEALHRHEGSALTLVGRLPRLGTPWDRAILIPIETLWEIHGLSNGHAGEDSPIGPPFDAATLPGVPLLVVKPASVAGAYALRGQLRKAGLSAVFPAEVLVGLYRTMGDMRRVLMGVTILNNAVVVATTTILLVALAGLRRRRYGVLRALGAGRGYILATVWLGAAILVGAGILAGILLAWTATGLVGAFVEARTGLRLAATLAGADLRFALALFCLASIAALAPALAAMRSPPDCALRNDP